VKAVLHDEIHKITNDILCGLLTYLHMGIMQCKLGKLSHLEHKENLLRNNAVPPGNEFPTLQSTIVLSVSVLDKGTTFLQKVRNHSPLIQHPISENMNLQQLCCENINLLNLCNVCGVSRKSTSGTMETRLHYPLKWLKI